MEINQLSQLLTAYLMQSNSISNNNETSLLFTAILTKVLEGLNSGEYTSTFNNKQFTNIENTNKLSNIQNDIKNELRGKEDIDRVIKVMAERYGVEEELIKAVIKQESGFRQNVVSKAGAIGLMQLMPGTAKSLGVNPYNAVENIEGGTKYLRDLLDKFAGNKALALAAYNGGIGRMQKRGVDTVEEIVKMPKETQNYVKKVLANYERYKSL